MRELTLRATVHRAAEKIYAVRVMEAEKRIVDEARRRLGGGDVRCELEAIRGPEKTTIICRARVDG